MMDGGARRVRYVEVLVTRDLLDEGIAAELIVDAVAADARLSGSWKWMILSRPWLCRDKQR